MVKVDKFKKPEIVKIDSCEGRREEKLDYLKLKFKSTVKLNKVTVSYEDRHGGRPTGQEFLRKPKKVFYAGQTLVLDISSRKCIDSIMIYGKPAKQGRYSHPNPEATIEIFAKIK